MMICEIIALRHAAFCECITSSDLRPKFPLAINARPTDPPFTPVHEFVKGCSVELLRCQESLFRWHLNKVAIVADDWRSIIRSVAAVPNVGTCCFNRFLSWLKVDEVVIDNNCFRYTQVIEALTFKLVQIEQVILLQKSKRP